ncbi:hypothetical protein KHQ82_01925 [Mycoplasmatota bacterium]|nr:hypothetical protein KHQ82_01925 [Mycoplasmatota bacterium]
MSDNFVRLIPKKVGVMFPDLLESLIENYLDSIEYKYETIRIVTFEDITFIDCGENLDSIRCNVCGANLDGWWQERMSESYNSGFVDRTIKTPCCSSVTELENLKYNFNCGFSKCEIEIFNPLRKIEISDIIKIEKIINCQLMQIIARY